MKLGSTLWHTPNFSTREICTQAKFVEDIGFDSFWLPENHFSEAAIPDPLMLLAAASAETTSLKLGTSSLLITLRDPLLTAESISVLDNLSGGRIIIGVGRGFVKQTLEAFNVDPREKRETFEKNLLLIRKSLRGERIKINDQTEAVITLSPATIQNPHPPIWLAAFGPKALHQAGTLGLPYIASPVETLSKLISNTLIYEDAYQNSVGKAQKVRPIMRTIFASEKKHLVDLVKSTIKKNIQKYPVEVDNNIDSWTIIGDPGYVRDKISHYRERLGITDLVVTKFRLPPIDFDTYQQSLRHIVQNKS